MRFVDKYKVERESMMFSERIRILSYLDWDDGLKVIRGNLGMY